MAFENIRVLSLHTGFFDSNDVLVGCFDESDLVLGMVIFDYILVDLFFLPMFYFGDTGY